MPIGPPAHPGDALTLALPTVPARGRTETTAHPVLPFHHAIPMQQGSINRPTANYRQQSLQQKGVNALQPDCTCCWMLSTLHPPLTKGAGMRLLGQNHGMGSCSSLRYQQPQVGAGLWAEGFRLSETKEGKVSKLCTPPGCLFHLQNNAFGAFGLA